MAQGRGVVLLIQVGGFPNPIEVTNLVGRIGTAKGRGWVKVTSRGTRGKNFPVHKRCRLDAGLFAKRWNWFWVWIECLMGFARCPAPGTYPRGVLLACLFYG